MEAMLAIVVFVALVLGALKQFEKEHKIEKK